MSLWRLGTKTKFSSHFSLSHTVHFGAVTFEKKNNSKSVLIFPRNTRRFHLKTLSGVVRVEMRHRFYKFPENFGSLFPTRRRDSLKKQRNVDFCAASAWAARAAERAARGQRPNDAPNPVQDSSRKKLEPHLKAKSDSDRGSNDLKPDKILMGPEKCTIMQAICFSFHSKDWNLYSTLLPTKQWCSNSWRRNSKLDIVEANASLRITAPWSLKPKITELAQQKN